VYLSGVSGTIEIALSLVLLAMTKGWEYNGFLLFFFGEFDVIIECKNR